MSPGWCEGAVEVEEVWGFLQNSPEGEGCQEEGCLGHSGSARESRPASPVALPS